MLEPTDDIDWPLGDFATFTPFSPSEVADVLRLPMVDVAFGIATGALAASIRGRDDPFGRLHFHSAWDVVEFEFLIRAGWPLTVGVEVRRFVSDLCDDLARQMDEDDIAADRISQMPEGSGHDVGCCLTFLESNCRAILDETLLRLRAKASGLIQA